MTGLCQLALPGASAAIRAEGVKKKRLSRVADSTIYSTTLALVLQGSSCGPLCSIVDPERASMKHMRI